MNNARNRLAVLALGLAGALAAPGRSPAGSISYAVDIGSEGPNVNIGELPQFGGSPGSLDGVYYTGSVFVGTEYAFGNLQSPVSYSMSVGLSFSGAGMSYGNVTNFTGNFAPYSDDEINATLNVSGWFDASDGLCGTGNLFLFAWTIAEFDVPCTDITYPNGYVQGELTVTYVYGVPEPPGLVLATIGAALPVSLIAMKRFTSRKRRA